MVVYFDAVLTYGDVDRLSDSFAVALSDNGFGRGDRLALYLQNVPQYVVALLAVWKLGGIAVAVNPMLTPREVAKLLADCTPKVLLTLHELHSDALDEVLADSSVQWTITTSALNSPQVGTAADEFACLVASSEGRRPTGRDVADDDVAVITYTSGTTGAPKGAMNTHRNIAAGGYAYRDWFDLSSDRRRPRGGSALSRHRIDRTHRRHHRRRRVVGTDLPLRRRSHCRRDPQA